MTTVFPPVVAVPAAAGLALLAVAVPVQGQTRFDDIRLIVGGDDEGADAVRTVLISDTQARRLRIEDRDGKVMLDVGFDQLRSLHFEESTYPPRLFGRSAPYVTIHYLRVRGEPAFASLRLSGDSAPDVLNALERDTGLRVDRSAPTPSSSAFPFT